MTQTTHLALNLFAGSDPVLVADLNANTQKLDKLPQVVSGTYTGTNAKGSANAVTLTFARRPMLLLVGGSYYMMLGMRGLDSMLARSCLSNATAGNRDVTVTWGSNSVSFYSDDNAASMCNDSQTYSYIAILGEE